jgi:hypothetical protein
MGLRKTNEEINLEMMIVMILGFLVGMIIISIM